MCIYLPTYTFTIIYISLQQEVINFMKSWYPLKPLSRGTARQRFKFFQKAFRLCVGLCDYKNFTIFCFNIFPSQKQPNSRCDCPIFTCGTLSFFPWLALQICQSRKHQQCQGFFSPLSARPLHAQVPEQFPKGLRMRLPIVSMKPKNAK